MCARYIWKKSLLVIFYPLGLFVKTLTVDDKYSLGNSEKLQEPIQMQLSKSLKTFSQHYPQFVQCPSNFKRFEKKKNEIHSRCISEIIDCQIYG